MTAREKAFERRWMYPAVLCSVLLGAGCSDRQTEPNYPAGSAQPLGPRESFEAFKKRFESLYQSFVIPLDETATSSMSVDEITYRVDESSDPNEPYTAQMTLKTTIQYSEIWFPVEPATGDAATDRSDADDPYGDDLASTDDPLAIDPATGEPRATDSDGRGRRGAGRRGAARRGTASDDPNASLFDQPETGELLSDRRQTVDVFDFGYRAGRWYLKTNEVRWQSTKLAIERALKDQ